MCYRNKALFGALFGACFLARFGLQMARMKKLILGLTLAAMACVSAQAGEDKKCEQSCADKAKAACAEKAKVAGTDCSGCCSSNKAKFTRKVDATAKGATLLLVRR